MKAQLFIPTGEVREVAPANGTDFTLEELQALVATGGFVEHVSLRDGRSMWVDEDGIEKELLPNQQASELYWQAGGMPGWFIRGNALVCAKDMVL